MRKEADRTVSRSGCQEIVGQNIDNGGIIGYNQIKMIGE
jgi:hypothetical protein